MKKVYISKLTTLLLTFFVFTVNAEISLKIDRDLLAGNEPFVPVIPLKGNTQISGSQVTIQSQHAIICNRIEDYIPNSGVKVRLLDPNGDNKGDGISAGDLALQGVQSNINYNLGFKTLNVTSQNRSKALCLSSEDFDVIFKDSMSVEPEPASLVVYNFLNEPQGGYAIGDPVIYEIIYENTTAANQLIDFVEYYPYDKTIDAYFTSPGGNINCSILDQNDQVVPGSFCQSSGGVVRDVDLEPGHKIKMSMSRTINNNSIDGSKLQMMAAVFSKVGTIDSTGSGTSRAANYSFSGFSYQHQLVPVKAN